MSRRRRPILDRLGGFNDFPPRWKPIPQSLFWDQFFLGWAREENRSMHRGESPPRFVHAVLFIRRGGAGVAVVRTGGNVPAFFCFAACDHRFDETTIARNFVRRVCRRCDYIEEVDSTG